MKYTVNKTLCTYTTPNGKYTIKKSLSTGIYYIYNISRQMTWNEMGQNTYMAIQFGKLKDAKEWVESNLDCE